MWVFYKKTPFSLLCIAVNMQYLNIFDLFRCILRRKYECVDIVFPKTTISFIAYCPKITLTMKQLQVLSNQSVVNKRVAFI